MQYMLRNSHDMDGISKHAETSCRKGYDILLSKQLVLVKIEVLHLTNSTLYTTLFRSYSRSNGISFS